MDSQNDDAVTNLLDHFTAAARRLTRTGRFDFGVVDEQDIVSEAFIRFQALKQLDKYRDRSPNIGKIVHFIYLSMAKKYSPSRRNALGEDAILGETFGMSRMSPVRCEDLYHLLTDAESELFAFFTSLGEVDYHAAERHFQLANGTIRNRWCEIHKKARSLLAMWVIPLFRAVQTDPYSQRYTEVIDVGATKHEKADFRLGLADIWIAENVRRYFEDQSPCPILLSKIESQMSWIVTTNLEFATDVTRNTAMFQYLEMLDTAIRSGRDSDVRAAIEKMPSFSKTNMGPVVLAPISRQSCNAISKGPPKQW